MAGWLDGWMDGWLAGWMDGWMDRDLIALKLLQALDSEDEAEPSAASAPRARAKRPAQARSPEELFSWENRCHADPARLVAPVLPEPQ